MEGMLLDSDFVLERSWYDEDRWFGVHLARVVDKETLLEDDDEEVAA